MKKILNILSVITLISIASSNVFACDDWQELTTEKIDLNEIIKTKSFGEIIFRAFFPLCTIFKFYHINFEKSLFTDFSPHF